MKQTLIDKYINGNTTPEEERELKQMLCSIPKEEMTKTERSILFLLSTNDGGGEESEDDIFAVDYSEEYERKAKPRRIVQLWPWVAAACVAGVAMLFITPPKNEEKVASVVPAKRTIIQERYNDYELEILRKQTKHETFAEAEAEIRRLASDLDISDDTPEIVNDIIISRGKVYRL